MYYQLKSIEFGKLQYSLQSGCNELNNKCQNPNFNEYQCRDQLVIYHLDHEKHKRVS